MSTATIASLLEQDIDDLTSTAGELEPAVRNELLALAAKTLAGPTQSTRLKLLGFVQALAAAGNRLRSPELEEIAIGLITAAHADDPTERLAALRALAVVVFRAENVNPELTHSVLAAFERARIDSAGEIRAFANEILAPDNPLFRQLMAVESATAD